MPKKSAGGAKKKDMHTSGFLVRLPEEYRERLQKVKEKTGCPFSESVRRALDAYLKTVGPLGPASQE